MTVSNFNTHEWEAVFIEMLTRTSVLDILGLQLSRFEAKYKTRPDRIVVNANCKMALIKALIVELHIPADKSVEEPIWIDGIPLIFMKTEMANWYVNLSSRRANVSINL